MHKAKALAIICIDFRFHDKIQQWLKDHKYLGQVDQISVAGVCRDLVKPLEEFHQKALLREIELSMKLHDPDEVLIFDHQDCGGYAQDGTIPGGLGYDDDKAQHCHFAEQVATLLKEQFPTKKIISLYTPLDKEIEVLMEK